MKRLTQRNNGHFSAFVQDLLQAASLLTYFYNPHPPAPHGFLPLVLSDNMVGVLTTLASVSNTIKWMPLLVNSWHT